MLSNSNKEIDTFAYTVSHDLQEPLRKIITFSERLKLKYSDRLGGEGIDYVDRITASAQSMRALIDSILTFSETSKRVREYRVIALPDIINTVIEVKNHNGYIYALSEPDLGASFIVILPKKQRQ